MAERTAIVVGGGIGGLAAAVGLAQTGWRVTVLEQASRFAPVGAGISLAPNAVRALDWLGVGEALRQRGAASGAAGIRTASGRWLMRSSVRELTAHFDVPAFVLHRADLHQLLVDAAANADLRTGHRVTDVENGTDSVAVSYDSRGGTGTQRADLVVAADGVFSGIREALLPDHPGAEYAGYVTWRGIVPAHAAPAGLPGLTETWGRGQRFGIAPLPDGRVYWFATTTGPETAHVDERLGDVAARFAGWHDPIPQLLATTPPHTMLGHDIYHLATPLPTYAVGRTALLGDAAHAVTPDLGQGAGQALEDAVTLAAHAASAEDVTAALAGYDRARRRRTQDLVRASARAGRLANARHALTAAARDTAAWLMPTSAYLRASADIFAWQPPARGQPAQR